MEQEAKTSEVQPQAPQQRGPMDAEAVRYVQSLMAGEAKPPNEYAADLVDQLRNANAEMAQLREVIPQLSQRLEAARSRQIALQAIMTQHGINLYGWRQKAEGKSNGR